MLQLRLWRCRRVEFCLVYGGAFLEDQCISPTSRCESALSGWACGMGCSAAAETSFCGHLSSFPLPLPSSPPSGLPASSSLGAVSRRCTQSHQGTPLPECFRGSLLPSGFSWALPTSSASFLAFSHHTSNIFVICGETSGWLSRWYILGRKEDAVSYYPGKTRTLSWKLGGSVNPSHTEPSDMLCVLSSVDLCFDVPSLPVCDLQPPVRSSNSLYLVPVAWKALH